MNRSIALFVALAVLVAHSFAIHSDGSGSLAPPYDSAYAAFRIAHSIVHEGSFAWMPGVPGLDAHPSPLWVLVCTVGERLYFGINKYVQGLGTLSAILTLILASRFHPDRIASLIAPLLLAISGGMAAAAVSGTETATLAFLVTLAFLSFERGWNGLLAISLLLCGLARPEGWLMAVGLGAIRLKRWLRATPGERRDGSLGPLAPFLAPAVGVSLVALLRLATSGELLSTWTVALARPDAARSWDGLGYLRDFLVCTASPLLLGYSLWYLARGRLSPTGRRALLIFFLWAALVAWIGGGGPIFGEALVPVLPIGLIAAQEGMITALNSTRRWVRGLAWASFLFAVAGSALASRLPGDLGPLRLAKLQEEWTRPSGPRRYGYEDRLGRAGLREEIAKMAELRSLGLILRDELSPTHSVLTPWPGAIGYLSRLPTYDFTGRIVPAAGERRRRPWHGLQRVDVLAQLERGADFIAPFNELPRRVPTHQEVAEEWRRELDSRAEEPGRSEALAAALDAYELIAVRLLTRIPGLLEARRGTAYLLRRRELGLAPVLQVVLEEGQLVVQLRHEGHQQLADLWVRAVSDTGNVYYLDPTGRFREKRPHDARSFLLIYPTGERSIELLRAALPAGGPRLVEITAVLRNPGAVGAFPYSFASAPARIELR